MTTIMREHYLEAELTALFQSDPDVWRFIQQGSLDGIWFWDLEHPDAEWMSPEMWRLLGVDPATKRHDPAEWQDLIFPEDLAMALANFELHCADPSHPYDQIVRYRHADGSTVWVRCRGVAIRDETGKPIRMLGAHTDLTQVKRAEEAAKTALRATSAANEELRSFAYGISHDLKSPSNTIEMLLKEIIGSAEAGTLTADQREMLDLAQATAAQMRGLIDDMLAYTSLIGERAEVERVSLYEIATDVCERLGPLVAETGADLQVDDDLPVVSGHAEQLGTLMQNLVENALKYKAPGRTPTIRITPVRGEDPASRSFAVSDNGIGIAPEHQGRIFELFKRLHRSDEISGSGLGLTLCRRVVVNHGGDIQVESAPGRGATFTVSIPGQSV